MPIPALVSSMPMPSYANRVPGGITLAWYRNISKCPSWLGKVQNGKWGNTWTHFISEAECWTLSTPWLSIHIQRAYPCTVLYWLPEECRWLAFLLTIFSLSIQFWSVFSTSTPNKVNIVTLKNLVLLWGREILPTTAHKHRRKISTRSGLHTIPPCLWLLVTLSPEQIIGVFLMASTCRPSFLHLLLFFGRVSPRIVSNLSRSFMSQETLPHGKKIRRPKSPGTGVHTFCWRTSQRKVCLTKYI